jgi:hypothetical protein
MALKFTLALEPVASVSTVLASQQILDLPRGFMGRQTDDSTLVVLKFRE